MASRVWPSTHKGIPVCLCHRSWSRSSAPVQKALSHAGDAAFAAGRCQGETSRSRGNVALLHVVKTCSALSPLLSAPIQGAHGWDAGLRGKEEDTFPSEPVRPPSTGTASHADPSLSLLQLHIHLTVITAEIPSGVSSLHVYYSFVYFFININCCYLCKAVHLAQFWWALKAPNWK